jgi:ADP-sugar diphosphatase
MSGLDFTLKDKDFPAPVPVRFLTKEISEEELLKFRPFNVWLAALKSSFHGQKEEGHPFHEAPYTLRSIDIQSVDRFGARGIGFVKIRAEIKNRNNESLPGVAFLRGGSVAILMILRPSDSKNERWVIMTEQPRIPAGSLTFMEIPAGMIDTQSFAGVAAEEIEEETGLVIPKTELLDLTELALGKQVRPDDLRKSPCKFIIEHEYSHSHPRISNVSKSRWLR